MIVAASVVGDLRLLLMLDKLNQANLLLEFTKAFELKALSNKAPKFIMLLAVDISIESHLISFIEMGFLRRLFISSNISALSMFNVSIVPVIQDLMSMTQFWMLLIIRGNDSALFGLKAMYSCVSLAYRREFSRYFRAIAPSGVV